MKDLLEEAFVFQLTHVLAESSRKLQLTVEFCFFYIYIHTDPVLVGGSMLGIRPVLIDSSKLKSGIEQASMGAASSKPIRFDSGWFSIPLYIPNIKCNNN